MAPPRAQELSFEYPYKTIEQLRKTSPSRQHGVSEEQEERWRLSALALIINAAMKLKM